MAKKTVEEPAETATKRRLNRKWLVVALVVVAVALIAFLIIGYFDAKKDLKKLSNPTEATKQERDDLVEKLSPVIELPANEEPTVATVKDVTLLQGQPFFKQAHNGDKVLIYTKAKRAVLYRPSTGKVIESAPVNFGNSSVNGSTPSQ